MEDHEGVVVLATNLRKNMDEAFVRRLHVIVEFPVPGAADRLRIWQQDLAGDDAARRPASTSSCSPARSTCPAGTSATSPWRRRSSPRPTAGW